MPCVIWGNARFATLYDCVAEANGFSIAVFVCFTQEPFKPPQAACDRICVLERHVHRCTARSCRGRVSRILRFEGNHQEPNCLAQSPRRDFSFAEKRNSSQNGVKFHWKLLSRLLRLLLKYRKISTLFNMILLLSYFRR